MPKFKFLSTSLAMCYRANVIFLVSMIINFISWTSFVFWIISSKISWVINFFQNSFMNGVNLLVEKLFCEKWWIKILRNIFLTGFLGTCFSNFLFQFQKIIYSLIKIINLPIFNMILPNEMCYITSEKKESRYIPSKILWRVYCPLQMRGVRNEKNTLIYQFSCDIKWISVEVFWEKKIKEIIIF